MKKMPHFQENRLEGSMGGVQAKLQTLTLSPQDAAWQNLQAAPHLERIAWGRVDKPFLFPPSWPTKPWLWLQTRVGPLVPGWLCTEMGITLEPRSSHTRLHSWISHWKQLALQCTTALQQPSEHHCSPPVPPCVWSDHDDGPEPLAGSTAPMGPHRGPRWEPPSPGCDPPGAPLSRGSPSIC